MADRKLRFRKTRDSEPIIADGDKPNAELGDHRKVDEPSDGTTSSDDVDGGEVINTDSTTSFDPASVSGDGDSSDASGDNVFSFSSGRRRRRGVGSSRKSKTGSQNIEKLLFGCHSMLAVLTKSPEIAITEEESIQLSKAIQEVNALYDVPVVPPWVIAWGNLVFVSGSIYGPRIMAIQNRREAEKVAKATSITPAYKTPVPQTALRIVEAADVKDPVN